MRPKFTAGLKAAALAIAVFWAYAPAERGGWIWDDAPEITQNPLVRGPAREIGRIWAGTSGLDYFPLKTTMQWAEWHLWGGHTLPYHLATLALHLAAALLFWRLLRRLEVSWAWFGSLIFALHPLAVESVAWLAELKNTLSLVFLLIAFLAHLGSERGRRTRLAAWACFAAALLCKTTVAMLPVLLLLHAWWKRRRISPADARASIPYFALSAALGAVTLRFQLVRAIGAANLDLGGFGFRIATAGRALVFYLEKFFAPAELMPIYPRWAPAPLSPGMLWPWLLLGAMTGACWIRRDTWGRGALFGLSCFAIDLLPVVGLAPMSYLQFSWVADHFVYLPLLGLAGLSAAGAGLLAARLPRAGRASLAGGAAAICALLALASHRYAGIYRDEEAFWSYALRRNPGAWLAENNLGMVLTDSGRLPAAIGHFDAAIRLRPSYAEAHNNLGNALARSGQPQAAIGEFVAAVRLRPNYLQARQNLGYAFAETGRNAEAIAQYQEALELDPGSATTHYWLANALGNAGRLPEAIAEYEAVLRLKPDFPEARAYLDLARRQLASQD